MLLVGDNNTAGYTFNADQYWSGAGEISRTFTATATGSATSISFYLDSWISATAAKLRLRDSGGNLLGEGAFTAADGTGVLTATLSANPSITAGTDYRISLVVDTGYIRPWSDDASWGVNQQPTSTYTTPEDPMAIGGGYNKGAFAMWVEGSNASIVDVDGDNTLVDGQQGFSITTSGFSSDLTEARLKVGASTVALTGLTKVT